MKIVQFTKDDGKEVMRDEVKKLCDRVMSGEIEGLLVIIETRGDFQAGRYHLSYETALGLMNRVAHNLNLEWDQKNRR